MPEPLIPKTARTLPLFRAVRELEEMGFSFVTALRRVIRERPELFEAARLDMPGDFADRLLRQLETIGDARLHTEPIALGRPNALDRRSLVAEINEETKQLAAERKIPYADALKLVRERDPERFAAAVAP